MNKCEVCQTPKGLLTCAFEDQPMLHFCPEDMIEHLEGAHPDSPAAQELARQLRATLAVSEAGLQRVLKLTSYQTLVYAGLIAVEVVGLPAYTDNQALDLIQKHEKLIADRERRRFEPYATARAIREAEAIQRLAPGVVTVNLNDKATVTLTDKGLEIWNKHWAFVTDPPSTTERKISAQLSTLMIIFGGSQIIEMPFVENKITIGVSE